MVIYVILKTNTYKNAVLAAEEFLNHTKDLEKIIKNQIDRQRLQQITENKQFLIIE